MNRSSIFFLLRRAIAAWLLSAPVLHADIKMPTIFGDHMVLQQQTRLPVWGAADAGEKVTVAIGSQTLKTTAGSDGKWRVNLAPLAGSDTPVTMTVTGNNTLKFEDVLIGDVWFCSGQSNMQLSIRYTEQPPFLASQPDDPQLRLFQVTQRPGLEIPGELAVGKWVLSTPETAAPFSAVGYYFGRELRTTLKRPIGMISSPIGGTRAEAWVPLEALKKDPALKEFVDRYEATKAAYPQASAEYLAKQAAFQTEMAAWKKEVGVTYEPLIKAWNIAAKEARDAGQELPPNKPQPSRPQPKAPLPPWGGIDTPSVLYNGAIAPIVPYAIKGAVWYQGESNGMSGNTADLYHAILKALIGGWREQWGQGDFPVMIAQLPKFIQGWNWPAIREAQSLAHDIPNSGMAVLLDLGDPHDVHPPGKIDAAQRLALVARHVAYGEDLVWTGPSYRSMKGEGNAIRLTFTPNGSGLTIGTAPWVAKGASPVPNDKLRGFIIAGEDQNWVTADAKIDGNSVVVSSPQVAHPVAVRYAWENCPETNLYNKEGLPAAPFRTDHWPLVPPPPPQ